MFASIQGVFVLRILEAGLIETVGFGFDSMFFVHAGWEAARVAAADYGGLVAFWLAALVGATLPLLRGLRELLRREQAARLSWAALAGAVAVFSLGTITWTGMATGLAVTSFANATKRYEPPVGAQDLTPNEVALLAELGIRLEDHNRYPVIARVPDPRPNLLLVLLESFQTTSLPRVGRRTSG